MCTTGEAEKHENKRAMNRLEIMLGKKQDNNSRKTKKGRNTRKKITGWVKQVKGIKSTLMMSTEVS